MKITVGVTERREARFTPRELLRQQYRTRRGEISGRKEKESLGGGTMEQWMKRSNSANASRSLIISPTKGNKFWRGKRNVRNSALKSCARLTNYKKKKENEKYAQCSDDHKSKRLVLTSYFVKKRRICRNVRWNALFICSNVRRYLQTRGRVLKTGEDTRTRVRFCAE